MGGVASPAVTDPSGDFEREMVERLLAVAQRTIDQIAVRHDAGAVDNLAETLTTELGRRGINDLSAEWIEGVAARIRAGQEVRLPSSDDLAGDLPGRPSVA